MALSDSAENRAATIAAIHNGISYTPY